MKRFESDIKQANSSLTAMRESLKAMFEMEKSLQEDFKQENKGMLAYLDNFEVYLGQWQQNLSK